MEPDEKKLQQAQLPDPEDDSGDDTEFISCSRCDGHPACEDFGCAYDLGLRRMVRKNIDPGYDDWG